MLTHFIGEAEVAAYCRDLARRLDVLGPAFPKQWILLGESGEKIGETILGYLPERVAEIEIGYALHDRTSGNTKIITPFEGVRLDRVLVIDSSVHTGKSMLKLVQALKDAGAGNVLSYSLVVKQGSKFIPSFFGVVIDDKDRAYFQLDTLPNNRLADPPPAGILRKITEHDVDKANADAGPPFTGLTIGDLYYDQTAKSSQVFIFESDAGIAGFINFSQKGRALFIDAWGVDKHHRGKKIGAALLRWAETWARSKGCERIELWAFETAIDIYLGYKFEFCEDRWISLGDGRRFKIMQKPILYNISINESGQESYH